MEKTSSTFEKTKQATLNFKDDFLLALVFLTRLPIKIEKEIPENALNQALRCFPVVGCLIGLIAAFTFALCHWFALPLLLSALITVLISCFLTGALHEDGLADVADGFGGGIDKDKKLSIMRDSLLGTYGVLALVFSIGLRVFALEGFDHWTYALNALIAAHALSRLGPVLIISLMDPARTDGLAATMEKPSSQTVLQACLIALGISFLAIPLMDVVIVLAVFFILFIAFMQLCEKQIGGQTGDTSGAVQQVLEIAILITLAGLL